MKIVHLAIAAALCLVAPATAQEAEIWRDVAPENLWVIDTSKGRVLVELTPEVAPLAVERIQTLTRRGFYDGLTFHRVIRNFMAQTGDPDGTGAGNSDLPDVPGEFMFRRGRQPAFIQTPTTRAGSALDGIYGVMPVRTQPDAQMFVTADNRVDAMGLFCPGVAGMARSSSPDSANSQFFLMSGTQSNLNGQYTPFGRIVAGMDVVQSLKAGSDENDGAVTDPDVMTRERLAADIPAGERPRARVLDARSARFAEVIAETQAERGSRFNVCDVTPPARID